MTRAIAITLLAVIAASGLVTVAAYKLKTADSGHAEEGGVVHHTVRQGETIESIAERYYGSKDLWPAIANANELKHDETPKPGTEIEIPSIPERRKTLLRNVLLPSGIFMLFALIAAGFVVKTAVDAQQPPLPISTAIYAVFLTALTGASVTAGALAGLIIRPDLLKLGIWLLPAYALPAFAALTIGQSIVLNLSTGISEGRAAILGIILNVILGLAATAVIVFIVMSA